MNKEKIQINKPHLDALNRFAVLHGRRWKRKLQDNWMVDGHVWGYPQAGDAALLREVRNVCGPSWLKAFKATQLTAVVPIETHEFLESLPGIHCHLCHRTKNHPNHREQTK